MNNDDILREATRIVRAEQEKPTTYKDFEKERAIQIALSVIEDAIRSYLTFLDGFKMTIGRDFINGYTISIKPPSSQEETE